MSFELHDDVELTESVGGFPSGSLGAIIALHDDGVEVEVIDRTSGETLGFVEPTFGEIAHASRPLVATA